MLWYPEETGQALSPDLVIKWEFSRFYSQPHLTFLTCLPVTALPTSHLYLVFCVCNTCLPLPHPGRRWGKRSKSNSQDLSCCSPSTCFLNICKTQVINEFTCHPSQPHCPLPSLAQAGQPNISFPNVSHSQNWVSTLCWISVAIASK